VSNPTRGPWTGRLLNGRYEVQELIGRGGMADVYRGLDGRLGRDVAIKVLKSTLSSDESSRTRFRNEAMAASKMAHPTIVRVFDAGDELDAEGVDVPTGSTTPYIVMEHVDGRLLSDIIHRGILDEAAALGIADGVLNALEVSHQAGIIHRDIKPANVMLTKNGGVKVMDFGIARAIADATQNTSETSSILGTALYISPEQAQGEDADERSDLYSLGVMLYEMLAGRPPFQADSPVAVAFQHINDEVPPIRMQNPEVSAGTARIVHQLMDKDRANRFQSAAEVRQALLALPEPGTEVDEVADRPKASLRAERPPVEPPVVTATIPQPKWESSEEPAVEFSLPLVGSGVQERSVPRLAIALGSVLAVSMLVAITFWLFTLNPTTVNTSSAPMVPDLVGQSEEVARNTIDALGLETLVIEEISGEFDEGYVIRTEPSTGIRVALGERVRVYVSAGADQLSVPDVINQTLEDATAKLEQAGLAVAEPKADYSPNLPEGTVMSMTPEPGEKVGPGDPVTLTVSNGLILVPDVTGLTIGEANPLLSGPELQLTVRLDPDLTCLGQTVQAQSLRPGEQPQRSEIVLRYCAAIDPTQPIEVPAG
jgi:serine/threonine protein kinase